MKIQYIKPVTDVVCVSLKGAVLEVNVPYNRGSIVTRTMDANSTSLNIEEEGDDFVLSNHSLWDE